MFERDWARACGKEKFASMMGREHKANMKNTKDDKGMMQEVSASGGTSGGGGGGQELLT
jgi:hypothetical protein